MTTAARTALDRAMALEQGGKSDAALSAYLDALEAEPDNIDIAYKTATALLRGGFLEEAVSQLRRIVFAEPDHTSARANLGNCQLLLGDLANAEKNFEEVLALAPDNRNALYGLGTVRLQLDRAPEAEAPATRLLELMPDSAPALTLYALTKAHDPQASAAIAAFRKALQIDGEYAPALLGLADVLIRRRRFDEAIALATRVITLHPNDVDAYTMLGEAHQAAGQFSAARQALLKALDLTGGQPELKVQISVISRKLGELGTALAYADDAYRANPATRGAGNALGAALAALGHPKDAKAVLTNVAQGQALADDLQARIDRLVAAVQDEPETDNRDPED